MKLPLLTSSACVLAISMIGCGSANRTDAPTGEGQQRIEGGQYDPDHTSVVGMYMQSGWGGGMCSGTLIAPNLVLTARHCVSSMTPNSEYVLCGESAFGAPHSASDFYITTDMQLSQNSDWYQGAEVRVPAESKDVCGYDQALVILSESVPGITPYIPRIDIEATTDEPYTAVGYGQTGSSSWGNWGGSRMVLGGLTVKCGAGECSFGGIQSSEWLGDTGICQGDSGGPALDANGKVIGVVSRGSDGCESPVYGAVSAWRDWIMQVAVDAAEKGAYDPPFWALSGKSDPESGTAGGGGQGGGGGSSSGSGGKTSSGGGSAQGQACSASVGCPSGFLCLASGDDTYCAAVCSAATPCAGGLSCNGYGVCENAATDPKSADSGSSGCSFGGDERGPVKPVPWLVGLALALGATLRRRRRS